MENISKFDFKLLTNFLVTPHPPTPYCGYRNLATTGKIKSVPNYQKWRESWMNRFFRIVDHPPPPHIGGPKIKIKMKSVSNSRKWRGLDNNCSVFWTPPPPIVGVEKNHFHMETMKSVQNGPKFWIFFTPRVDGQQILARNVKHEKCLKLPEMARKSLNPSPSKPLMEDDISLPS